MVTIIRDIRTEYSNVTETSDPELGSGLGAKYESGGTAIAGGDCEIGCRPITSTSSRWPFLQ